MLSTIVCVFVCIFKHAFYKGTQHREHQLSVSASRTSIKLKMKESRHYSVSLAVHVHISPESLCKVIIIDPIIIFKIFESL